VQQTDTDTDTDADTDTISTRRGTRTLTCMLYSGLDTHSLRNTRQQPGRLTSVRTGADTETETEIKTGKAKETKTETEGDTETEPETDTDTDIQACRHRHRQAHRLKLTNSAATTDFPADGRLAGGEAPKPLLLFSC
jgi:hypothetical protein